MILQLLAVFDYRQPVDGEKAGIDFQNKSLISKRWK